MVAYISDPPETQTITAGNVLTENYNDGTWCQGLTYSLSPTFSYLDLTGTTITLQSNTPSDAPALETITLTVSTTDDPSKTATATFTVDLLGSCRNTMTVPESPDITYNIVDTGHASVSTPVSAPTVSFSDPGCSLISRLEIENIENGQWEDYSTMGADKPSWITNFNSATLAFDIDTNDLTLIS